MAPMAVHAAWPQLVRVSRTASSMGSGRRPAKA